jgi:hypothetical protein
MSALFCPGNQAIETPVHGSSPVHASTGKYPIPGAMSTKAFFLDTPVLVAYVPGNPQRWIDNVAMSKKNQSQGTAVL